jgi:glycerophosphoryl diester phosphodiesterase
MRISDTLVEMSRPVIQMLPVLAVLLILSASCGSGAANIYALGEVQRSVKIIAHRGAPTFAPENTLPAIKKAVEIGVHMIEIDLHQTKDNHIVVIHDENVRKTTDGRGYVRDMTLDEIKQLDAGRWFSEEYAGTRVPTLEEVFTVMDDTTKLLLEIKKGSPYYPGMEQRVIDLVYKHNFQDRVLMKSFDDGPLEYFRRYAPEIPAGKSFAYRIPFLRLIIERGLNTGSVFNYDADFLHSHRIATSRRFVPKANENGFGVYVWDVHTEKRMRKYIGMGVDAIETDYPHVLRRIIINAESAEDAKI